ncbi:MAG: collagen-like protein [Saprospiraceae bacterium]|nr:collagen-like protein [Saprospiraceae bacterium]
MKKVLSMLLMISLATFMSCKGEQGDTGPAGPAGQNGQNGQDGNANIKTFTTTVSSSNWVEILDDYSEAQVNVPIITSDIVNSGLVMVYMQSGSSWTAWPYAVAFDTYTEAFSFTFATGSVTLRDISNDNIPIEPTGPLRVIAATADGMVRYPDLDWYNYEAVMNALQLAD